MLNFITKLRGVRPAAAEKTITCAVAGSIVRVRRATELSLVGIVVEPTVPLVLLASIKAGQTTAIVRWEGRGNYEVDVAALSPIVEFTTFEEARRRLARPSKQVRPALRARTITEYVREEPIAS